MPSPNNISPFKTLTTPDCERRASIKAFELNSKEIIVVFQTDIWKYNNHNNEWTKMMDIDVHKFNIRSYNCHSFHCMGSSLDTKKMEIYSFSDDGHIITIDLKSKQVVKSKHTYDDIDGRSLSLFINDQLHIFTSKKSERQIAHFTWNKQKQKLTEIALLGKTVKNEVLNDSFIAYLSLDKSFLLSNNLNDKIHSYSLVTNESAVIKTKRNRVIDAADWTWKMVDSYSRAVLTKENRYIIHFWDDWDVDKHDIEANCYIDVLDLRSMEWTVCSLQWPSELRKWYNCVESVCLRHDENRERLSTSGFIRHCWKETEFSTITYPPWYLINIIQSYIAYETVHIFDEYTGHWSIDIDSIFEHTNITINH